MSPSKPPKNSKQTLTIEFSGICTFLWDRKEGSAVVRMVDLASAGFDRHYVALGLVVTEDMAKGVKGPDADAAISWPGAEADIGLWNLLGTDVEIVGAKGKLTVDDAKVDVTKKPDKNATSVNWLANVGLLAESKKLDPVCPTAATVQLPAGHVTAYNVGAPQKIEFLDSGTPIGPPRYCLSRFRVAIPFDSEIALRLDRRRVMRFTESNAIMISNMCVCGLGVNAPPDHFYAHYDVVRAKRRPTVERAGGLPKIPEYPELCLSGFVEV
jgi:hypothetical protein